MISAEEESSMARSLKEGFIAPLQDMIERAKKETELREKTTDARYALTQKKIDIIEEKIDKVIKLLEEI